MRKLIDIPLASIGLSVVAFRLLKFDSDQMSSGGIGMYSYIPGFALFLLFVAFALLFVLSAILSRRLRPPMALLLGIVVLAAAVVTWMSLLPSVNVHYLTSTLLIVPVILFLCGFLLFLVGAIRWTMRRFHSDPRHSRVACSLSNKPRHSAHLRNNGATHPHFPCPTSILKNLAALL